MILSTTTAPPIYIGGAVYLFPQVSLRVSVIKGHFHFSIPFNPVIKVIKDFVFSKYPPTSLYLIK